MFLQSYHDYLINLGRYKNRLFLYVDGGRSPIYSRRRKWRGKRNQGTYLFMYEGVKMKFWEQTLDRGLRTIPFYSKGVSIGPFFKNNFH